MAEFNSMPLSEKQLLSYTGSTKRLNIWEGSVRSGKSFISIIRFIKELRSGPAGHAMIVGPTRDSIQRNVIVEMCHLLGFPCPTPKTTQMVMFDRIIYFVGANDERAQRKIQGATLAIAYVDEMSLIPYGFIKMLQSRLSVTGAKLFGTTNPDSPFHWLKTEFLDNPDIDLTRWHFRIEDNPSLDNSYIDALKSEYSGLWYKRYIEGQWVLADGTVYEFFDEEQHVIQMPSKRADYYIVGVDYGTTNPSVFCLIGYNPNNYPNIWLEKEYYYSSRVTNRQKTDTEYAEDLQEFIQGYNVQAIYLDPSAASFRAELSRQGVDDVLDADNDVINGIRFQSQLLANGTYKICGQCVNAIREYGTYVWDSKASLKGEDKPIKENDHCFVAGTLVLTDNGNKPIEEIGKGDFVRVREGWKPVIDSFQNQREVSKFDVMGQSITCTPDHKFHTLQGWKEISNMTQSDMIFIETGDLPWLKLSNLTESNIDVIQTLKTLVTEDIIEHTKQIHLKDMGISIGIFGNSTMEKFHPDTIFITKTEIPSTIVLATWSVSHLMHTIPCMEPILQKIRESIEENLIENFKRNHLNGIEAMKVEHGMWNTQKNNGKTSPYEALSVNHAKQNTKQTPTNQNFVQISVSHNGEEIINLIMNLDNAFIAEKNLKLTDLKKQSTARNHVPRNHIGKRTVYNIHVKEHHEYFVNGILVKNSMDAQRYALYTHFGQSLGSSTKPQDLDRYYQEAMGYGNELPKVFQQPNQIGVGSYF